MADKKQNNSILLAIIGFASVVIIVALIGHFAFAEEEEIIQGEVEVNEYRVACKYPGRIKEIKVKEGDEVHKGDVVAILEIPEATEQEKVMQATATAAQAMSDLAEAPTRSEMVESAYQLYQQAKTANEIAEKTYGRLNRLYEEGVISAQKRDEAEAAYKSTTSAVEIARSQWELAKKGAREETKRVAQKQADAARTAVGVVKSVLKETVQYATADGEVESIYPKEGELVGLGSPIMTVALVDDVWATFSVREDLLKGLKVGKIIKAYVPAIDKTIDMKVTAIKSQGAYAVWKATKTTGQYDLKTFQVKAQPIKKQTGLKAGMSVVLKNKY